MRYLVKGWRELRPQSMMGIHAWRPPQTRASLVWKDGETAADDTCHSSWGAPSKSFFLKLFTVSIISDTLSLSYMPWAYRCYHSPSLFHILFLAWLLTFPSKHLIPQPCHPDHQRINYSSSRTLVFCLHVYLCKKIEEEGEATMSWSQGPWELPNWS